MSVIKTSNVSWNNIKVDQYTNIQTGYTHITLPGQTGKLAESSSASWTILDINTLTRIYNAANLSALTTEEVETLFFRSARLVYNQVRDDVINDSSNYPSTTSFELWMAGMFDNRIPGATNPVDGRTVNNTGGTTRTNVFNTSVPRVSTFQTRTSGTPVTGNFQSSNFLQLASTGNENTYKKSGGFASLRYPSGKLSGTDYIQFSAFEYKARQTQLTSSSGLFGGDINRRLSGSPLGGVQLPIQPNIEDNNGVQWGRDSINFLQAAAAQVGGGLINDLSSGEGIQKTIDNALKNITGPAKSLFKDAATEEFLKAYFTGKAVGANVLTRATGQIVNPNLELLFTGPSLRSFNFNFVLTPRDEGEANSIKQIIRFFKKNMAVRKSDSAAFLFTPNVFKLQYIYNGGGQHPYLNLFKPCALTTFKVQYTPEGTYNTYDDGSMTQYRFAMGFNELEPIYADDQEQSGGTGY